MRRATLPARGYTMIELVMVIVILAILAGMAALTYASTLGKGQDSSLQGTLRALSIEEQSYFATYGAFTSDPTVLTGIEPNYSFLAGASTGSTSVSVATGTVGGSAAVGMAILGASGYCNTINVVDPTQSRADLTGRYHVTSGTPCTGTYALSTTAPTNPW